MARKHSGFVSVFVQYPTTSHRSKVAPGFSPWGGQVIRATDQRSIDLASNAARLQGCQVRIMSVAAPEDRTK